MSRLHHPNIVALHGLMIPPSDLGDGPALVMEYVPGGTLFDALHSAGANQLLPRRSRVSIALQVARAMRYMHGQGIVHLDLKPSNLYLDMRDPARPVCKIGDFNTAIDRTFNRKVSTQRIIGNPGYQAPELTEEIKRDIGFEGSPRRRACTRSGWSCGSFSPERHLISLWKKRCQQYYL